MVQITDLKSAIVLCAASADLTISDSDGVVRLSYSPGRGRFDPSAIEPFVQEGDVVDVTDSLVVYRDGDRAARMRLYQYETAAVQDYTPSAQDTQRREMQALVQRLVDKRLPAATLDPADIQALVDARAAEIQAERDQAEADAQAAADASQAAEGLNADAQAN